MSKTTPNDLLNAAPKAIAHLRGQYARKRLGLIFGSGASKDLGFPDWNQLVDRIAAHDAVAAAPIVERFRQQGSATRPITRSLASVTQMLFSHYRTSQIELGELIVPLTFLEEQNIRSRWQRIIHQELYRDLTRTERSSRLAVHPYLPAFLDIIKHSPLTVNYNFDDTLERMLLRARKDDEVDRTRGYEVTDRPNAQFQKDNSVIYHPNGYLPSIFEDGASAEVIFSDDAFQDQLISAATGKYLNLSNHLFRNTCLLVGLSLEDSTLQSLLRQNAVSTPGNVHYFIQFTDISAPRDQEAERAIFRANFESFNLYTLFLDETGIEALAKLIAMSEAQFSYRHGKTKPRFVYYVVGSVGSGKSTAAANFRNLTTYDEWIDERQPELAKPEADVDADRVGELNDWIAEQFRKKNFALMDGIEGLHIVDRAPLDPLTFGPTEGRPAKARALLKQITDDGTRELAAGHIIHLDCSIEDIRIRNSLKHKYWPDSEYERLLIAMGQIYGSLERSIICTRGRSAAAVAKEIAKVIFLEPYREVDLGAELERIANAKHD